METLMLSKLFYCAVILTASSEWFSELFEISSPNPSQECLMVKVCKSLPGHGTFDSTITFLINTARNRSGTCYSIIKHSKTIG